MKEHDGFTLIEALIVIAIIGILVALLLPNFLRARDVAEVRAAEVHVRNVYIAASAYVAEDITSPVVEGDCMTAYVAGGYSVAEPESRVLLTCNVTDVDGNRIPEVVANLSNGSSVMYP